MRSTRSLLLAAVLAAAAGACSDSSGTDNGPSTVALRAVEASVRVGDLASFVKPGGGLTAASYAGTMGDAAVTFGQVDDSTLVVMVPGTVSPGTVGVQVELGSTSAGGTIRVTAGATIADPDAAVTAAFDAAAAVVRAPAPGAYGGDWAADSALVERELAAARAAFAQLGPADRLEVARLTAGLGLDASGPAARATGDAGGRPLLALASSGAAADAACARELVGWYDDVGSGEKAAAAAVAWHSSPFKWAIAKAVSLTKYVESVLTMGKVGNICTMEQDFAIDDAPTADGTGTEVEVTADRRTFVDTDALASEMADRYVTAKERTKGLFAKLVALFSRDGARPSEPTEPAQGEVVEVDVPVEAERVTLQTTQVTTADGSSVGIRLVRRGGATVVEALGDVRQAVRRKLGFSVSRTGFETKQVESDVEIQSVCFEAGQLLPGCVESIAISPSDFEVGLGETGQLTAVAYDAAGKVLNRAVTWESSDQDILTVTNPSGYYQGLKEGGPVTVSAITGQGPSMRRGTTQVTVTATDSTAIYEQAVLGVWTVSLLDGTASYQAELLPGGKTVYRVPYSEAQGYCPNTGPPVNGNCEYRAKWEIRRYDRYYLFDGGFWHPAYDWEDRDPLTMPVGSFTTYSNLRDGAPSRRFTR